VYDGPNNTFPRIATFSGNRESWAADILISSSRYLTLNLISDSAIHEKGFLASFEAGIFNSTFLFLIAI